MKNIIYTAILTAGFLWQPCSAPAQQDEKAEIARLRGQVRELEERNAFLKTALGLRSSPLERTMDDIRVRLTHFYGSPDGKRIHLRGMATYTGNGKVRIRIRSAEIVDAQGSFYKTLAVCDQNSSSRFDVDSPEPHQPYAFSAAFDSVKEKMPEAALIRLKIDSGPFSFFGKDRIFNFRSVGVGYGQKKSPPSQPKP